MNYLLDTHIWLWSIREPHRLSSRVRSVVEDTDNPLWLSPISIWEALVLIAKKRIDIKQADPVVWVEKELFRLPLRDAPMTRQVSILTSTISLQHSDLADRFLVATAIAYDLTFITADAKLIQQESCTMLPNEVLHR